MLFVLLVVSLPILWAGYSDNAPFDGRVTAKRFTPGHILVVRSGNTLVPLFIAPKWTVTVHALQGGDIRECPVDETTFDRLRSDDSFHCGKVK